MGHFHDGIRYSYALTLEMNLLNIFDKLIQEQLCSSAVKQPNLELRPFHFRATTYVIYILFALKIFERHRLDFLVSPRGL